MDSRNLYNLQSDMRNTQLGVEAVKRNSTVAHIVTIVYAVFALLDLLLLARVILHLLGAGPDNGLVNGVNILSSPFVVIFANVTHNPVLSTTAALEINTIVAMIAYGILVWMLGRVIRLWRLSVHLID